MEPLVKNMRNCRHKSFKTWTGAYQYYVDNWNACKVERIPITEGPYDNPLDPCIRRPTEDGATGLEGAFGELRT